LFLFLFLSFWHCHSSSSYTLRFIVNQPTHPQLTRATPPTFTTRLLIDANASLSLSTPRPPFHLTIMNAPPALGYPPGVSLSPTGA
jgi:hypothetical protein